MVPWSDMTVYFPDGLLSDRAVYFPDGSLIRKSCLFSWWFPDQTLLFFNLMVPRSDRAVYFPDGSLVGQGCLLPWSEKAVHFPDGSLISQCCIFSWWFPNKPGLNIFLMVPWFDRDVYLLVYRLFVQRECLFVLATLLGYSIKPHSPLCQCSLTSSCL